MDKVVDNRVIKLNYEEFESIKFELALNRNLHIVDLIGVEIQSWEDYISEIQTKFKFPTACFDSMDRYLDWIRDLEWLGKDGYVLIINGYSDFLKENPKLKEEIISDLADVILPFWQEEVKKVVVEGEAKPFTVYLID